RVAMVPHAATPGTHHGQKAQECVLMVTEAGMTPQQSIHCTTMNPAKLLRQEQNLGSLDAGKYADIVACRANPLDDIEEITRIAFVMKGGIIYKDELTQ